MSTPLLAGALAWALAGLLPPSVELVTAGVLGAGAAPDPNDPNPQPEPDPNDPDPDPDPPDPDPLPEPPEPEPPPDPEPVPPDPDPVDDGGDTEGDSGGGGDGSEEPGDGGDDGDDGSVADDSASELTPAPFAQLDVADRESELELGGDLTVGPLCKDDRPAACDNVRVGLRLRLPVTQSSTSGTGRAAIDSLNGFAGAWRVGGVVDWIRDVTSEDSDAPAKFYMLSVQGSWGVQTFRYSPAAMGSRKQTRHSVHTLARFLAYIHPPRKTRVAPQVLLRYDRQWSGSDAVGVLMDDGNPETPLFTVPIVIDAPVTTPVFAVTVPVLVSVQSGKGRAGRVLSQLGLGPAVSYAAAGNPRGYTPFDDMHVLRFETWVYWYPLGKAGQLAATKPNARVGVSPFVDVFVAGRDPGQPTVDFGVLAEVKVGVRGYEY